MVSIVPYMGISALIVREQAVRASLDTKQLRIPELFDYLKTILLFNDEVVTVREFLE